jgi:hypothetical protein
LDGKWISYLSVSTDRQGKSGLGIEAQRNSVAEYLNGGNWKLVKELVKVESGKNTNRPMLAEAIMRPPGGHPNGPRRPLLEGSVADLIQRPIVRAVSIGTVDQAERVGPPLEAGGLPSDDPPPTAWGSLVRPT